MLRFDAMVILFFGFFEPARFEVADFTVRAKNFEEAEKKLSTFLDDGDCGFTNKTGFIQSIHFPDYYNEDDESLPEITYEYRSTFYEYDKLTD